jgi:hypothetical protein
MTAFSFNFNTILVICFCALMVPGKVVKQAEKVQECKTKKAKVTTVASKPATETLHGELLFRF